MHFFDWIGRKLARYLSKPRGIDVHFATNKPEVLAETLRKGDVLLVEGSSRFGVAIKYLTQSSWSHSALFVGDALGPPKPGEQARVLVDADINEGVRAIPLSEFSKFHTRICRPVGLSADEIDRLITHVISRIGQKYDLRNLFDLVRYLIQTPPLPSQWRRRMLTLGSGDPTKAICSTLIAQAFQSVRYPILPEVIIEKAKDPNGRYSYKEMLQIKHYSLFAPRDFDVSPYFQIVKPTIEQGFDPHKVEQTWEAREDGTP